MTAFNLLKQLSVKMGTDLHIEFNSDYPGWAVIDSEGAEVLVADSELELLEGLLQGLEKPVADLIDEHMEDLR